MADIPKPGEMVDGYVFKGGDPKDQGSWELPPSPLGVGTAPAGAPQAAVPNTGDIVDGHAFQGGDPKDPKSWVKAYTTEEALKKGTNLDTLMTSAGKRIGEFKEALFNPVQTISHIGRIGLELQPMNIGNYAKLKLKAMMASGDEAKQLDQQANALMGGVEPILQDYYETYGSKEKFLRTIAEDPTRLLSDLANVAMPLKGGATAAATTAAKTAGTAGKVLGGAGKAAGIAGSVIENLDVPTALINATAKIAEKGGKMLTDIGGVRTGIGGGAIREAAEAAAKGGDHFDDFRRGLAGSLGEDEMVGRARQGIRTMRDDMQAEYLAKHGALPTGGIPAFGDIDQIVTKADDSLFKTFPSGQRDTILSPADQGKWQNVLDVVERWRQDPTRHTVTGLDDLKQAVRNQLAWTDKNRNLQRAVTEVTNGIIDSVKKHAPPEYGKMLEEYAPAAKLVEEIEKEFALGKNRTPQQAMTKLQSILRNNVNTRFGKRVELADLLEEKGGVRLKSGIAGMTMNSAEPRSLARVGGGAFGGTLGFLSGLGPIGIPIGIGLEAIADSPKTWAAGAQGYGLGRRALDAKARIGNWTSPSARELIAAPFQPGTVRAGEVLGRDKEEQGHARGGPVQRRAAFSRYTR